MSAEDALREMRAEGWAYAKAATILLRHRVWADAIEAEIGRREDVLLACRSVIDQKKGDVAMLQRSNHELHVSLAAKDAEIARIKKRLTKYEGPGEPYE